MPEPIAVDEEGAAELLGLSARLVRELTAEGALPSIDVGGHRVRLYSVDALRQWALERSDYVARKEVSDGEAGQSRRRSPVPAKAGRALGRGRPRSGQPTPLPVRRAEG